MMKVEFKKECDLKDRYYKHLLSSKIVLDINDNRINDKTKEIVTKINYQSTTLNLEQLFNHLCAEDSQFQSFFQGFSLKELLSNSYFYLLSIKPTLDKRDKTNIEDLIEFVFNYEKRQPLISSFFEENVILGTCYYCNIDYINIIQYKDKNNEEKVTNFFTLDHVIDKGKNPWFALSFYNLIPTCYACNSKLKKEKNFDGIDPNNFDGRFSFIQEKGKTLTEIIQRKENLEIHIKGSHEYDKYIDVLKLKERYNFHKEHFLEIIKKSEEYSDARIEDIVNILGKDFDEVKKDIFGKEIWEKEKYKLPFSKAKTEIYEQLQEKKGK